MKLKHSKQDELWKFILTTLHQQAILFYFGKKLHDEIDWSVEPESLEQEFNDAFTANEPNRRAADKIFRYRCKNGTDRFIIFHIEVQDKKEADFKQRMFEYYNFIRVKYRTFDILALAIYIGKAVPKSPDIFEMNFHGVSIRYKFIAFIIRDQVEAKLIASDNPFALVALAGLYKIKAGSNPTKRLAFKKKLLDVLLTKKYDHAIFFQLNTFVKYLIRLPKPLSNDYDTYFNNIKTSHKMVTWEIDREYIEGQKSIFEKALNEYMAEAEQKGIETGIQKGRKEGMQTGMMQTMERTILKIHNSTGMNAQQIANMTDYPLDFVERVLQLKA
jgi:hypothetical protein